MSSSVTQNARPARWASRRCSPVATFVLRAQLFQLSRVLVKEEVSVLHSKFAKLSSYDRAAVGRLRECGYLGDGVISGVRSSEWRSCGVSVCDWMPKLIAARSWSWS